MLTVYFLLREVCVAFGQVAEGNCTEPAPVTVPDTATTDQDDLDSLRSSDMVHSGADEDDADVPPQPVPDWPNAQRCCSECNIPYAGPYPACSFCGESPSFHHGRCCGRRYGDMSSQVVSTKLLEMLEDNAKERDETIEKLRRENDELRKRVEHYCVKVERLEFAKAISDASVHSPHVPRQGTSTMQVCIDNANDRLVDLWEQNKTMRAAIADFVDSQTLPVYHSLNPF